MSNVKDTSAAAYADMDKGKITQDILDCVKECAPVTRKEIATITDNDASTVSGVLKPFINAGKVYEIRKRPCRITGRNVWELGIQPDLVA